MSILQLRRYLISKILDFFVRIISLVRRRGRSRRAAAEGVGKAKCATGRMLGLESYGCRQKRIEKHYAEYVCKIYFALAAIGGRSIYSYNGNSDLLIKYTYRGLGPKKFRTECRNPTTNNWVQCVGWGALTIPIHPVMDTIAQKGGGDPGEQPAKCCMSAGTGRCELTEIRDVVRVYSHYVESGENKGTAGLKAGLGLLKVSRTLRPSSWRSPRSIRMS